MRIYKIVPLIGLVLLLGGCLEQILSDLEPHLDTATNSDSTSATSTGEPATPTTSAGLDPVQTVTGPPGETAGAVDETTGAEPGTTTGAPVENTPPTVVLSVEPELLDEAGKTAKFLLGASADVITVRLSMNGGEAVELTPADFPYTYEALSAKDNGMPHVFTVEVEDEEGLTATDDAKLTVQLPASGAEKCLFEDNAANGGMFSALVYTKTAIVGVGWRDKGTGPKAAIWKLDPEHCEEALPGWPKVLENWTEDGDPDLAALASSLSAVAVDEHGHIAVGGNLIVNNKPQRYTALLTESGGRLWERAGAPGEVVSSVVIAPEDLVISGGWVFTSDNPPRTDARFWRHLPDKTVWKTDLAAPFTADEPPDLFNEQSEKIRAMLIEPETGFLVVVGEREFKPDIVNTFTRAFIARYVPLGAHVGSPATSPGDAYRHEAMYSIALCGNEFIAGGWTRDDKDPKVTPPQPQFRWASNGVWSEKKLLEPMLSAELRGAACDREGKVVGAGVRSAGGSDAKVFAFTDPLGYRTWYETGIAGNDEANGVVCDVRGFCAWPGYRTINGKPVAVVRVHHP